MAWGNITDHTEFFLANYNHVKPNMIILCHLTSTAKAFFYSKVFIFFNLYAIYNISEILCKDEDQDLIKWSYHVLHPKNVESSNAGNQHSIREES